MGLDFSCRRNTLPKPRPPLSALTRAAILELRAGLRNGAKADPKEAIQNITKTLDKESCILLNLRDLLVYREEKLLLYYEGATTTPASQQGTVHPCISKSIFFVSSTGWTRSKQEQILNKSNARRGGLGSIPTTHYTIAASA